MKNTTLLLFLMITFCVPAHSENTIPQWFQANMEASVGTWTASNAEYQSENEPIESYVMEWKWGIGKTSIIGGLYGLINGKKTGAFWEFRQYWDFEKQQGIVAQYGGDGTIGVGAITSDGDNGTSLDQVFISPDGTKKRHGHRSIMQVDKFTATSFDIGEDEKWVKRRSYIWYKDINDEEGLGEFSISLSVKDIKVSKSFYEKLGFVVVDGDLSKNWLILKNGTTKVGLFQGFFPRNTMTFHPNNARSSYKLVKESEIPVIMANGFDQTEGPASYMISDPDGNPILVDQLK